jgi:RHS repeat-associated protein
VYQIVATTSTSTYPFKFFSVASTTKSSTNYATSTEYVFNGDTLLSTVDQKIVNGAASGAAAVRYVHPDHLGSTNVVTDQNQNLVQTLDYYPYGATRVSVSTSTNEKRKWIDQFSDDSGLYYLNARFYNPNQGQFLTQDPTFLALGNPSQLKQLTQQEQNKLLTDPQLLNSYGYARDNPITNKDATGLISVKTIYRGLDIISNILFAQTTLDYSVSSPRESAQELRNDQSQFNVDLFMSGAVATAGALTPSGAAINGGGILLSGLGWYCSGQPCSTFEGAQYVSPQTILASLPKPKISADGTNPKGPTFSQNSFSGTTVQQRQAAVNSYNSASGATAPQQQLWATPSGAVVTWGGQVVAGPVSSPANKK